MAITEHEKLIAELSILHEISSFELLDSEESIGHNAIAKASRLFGIRYFAWLRGKEEGQNVVASWGFRHPADIYAKIREEGINQFSFSFGEFGLLFMEHSHPLSDKERRLYSIFARQMERSLMYAENVAERRQAEEKILRRNIELQQLNSELKALYDVSRAISKTLDIGELVTEVMRALVRTEVFPFEIRGAIFLEENGEMFLASFMGITETDVEPCNKIENGQCLCGRAMSTGEVVISRDSREESGHEHCTHAGGAHGHVIIPLTAVSRTVGILSLYTKPDTDVNEGLIELFKTLGGQIGIALNNARLYEETKKFSLHDPLTGLANRRFMDLQLEKNFEAARRYQEELSVVMIDIDHFKRYNDTYGHPGGDRLLVSLAAILLKSLRSADTLFRYGGEEFLVILPETGLTMAAEVAERLRMAVESEAGVTISLGIASLTGNIAKKEELISDADKALYLAKQNGRNRVELVQPQRAWKNKNEN